MALGPDQVDLVRIHADTILAWSGLKPRSLNATWWGDPNGNGVWEQVNVAQWAPEPVLHLDPEALQAGGSGNGVAAGFSGHVRHEISR